MKKVKIHNKIVEEAKEREKRWKIRHFSGVHRVTRYI